MRSKHFRLGHAQPKCYFCLAGSFLSQVFFICNAGSGCDIITKLYLVFFSSQFLDSCTLNRRLVNRQMFRFCSWALNNENNYKCHIIFSHEAQTTQWEHPVTDKRKKVAGGKSILALLFLSKYVQRKVAFSSQEWCMWAPCLPYDAIVIWQTTFSLFFFVLCCFLFHAKCNQIYHSKISMYMYQLLPVSANRVQLFSPWAEISSWEIKFDHFWDQCKSGEKIFCIWGVGVKMAWSQL